MAVGLLAAGPLSRLLLQPVETYMGLSGGNPLTLPLMLLAGAVITGIIMFGVRSALRRLDRLPAVQAIRTGTPQAQGAIRRVPSLLSAGPDVNVRLGLRDALNRPAGYAVPFLIITLAAFILTVPQNLYSTVTQPEFITYMGAGVSDMRIDYQPVTAQRLQELDQALAADSRVDRHTVLTTASYLTTDPTGRTVNLNVESGDQQAFPISYLEGRAPAAQGELALSKLLADSLGAEPGSSLTIDPVTGTEPLQLTVTGVYQDLTNGGRTARMTTSHSSSELMWATVYADLVPGSVLGAVLANVLGGGLAGLLLSPVGLSRLTLVANPLQAWLLTPLALLAVVIAVTLLSSRPGRGAAIPMTLKELT